MSIVLSYNRLLRFACLPPGRLAMTMFNANRLCESDGAGRGKNQCGTSLRDECSPAWKKPMRNVIARRMQSGVAKTNAERHCETGAVRRGKNQCGTSLRDGCSPAWQKPMRNVIARRMQSGVAICCSLPLNTIVTI